MKRSRLMVLVLSLILIVSLLFVSACANGTNTVSDSTPTPAPVKDTDKEPGDVNDNEDTVVPDPFGKYDEPIKQSTIRILTSWMALDDGDDENNNIWTREIKDKLGVELSQLWTAPDWGPPFDEKVNLAIASDQLPDIIPVYTTLFYRMVDGGKLTDLSQVYEEYASPRLREMMALGDGVGLKSATFDGKLYGLGGANDYSDRTLLWLRKDWMDKLDLQPPKTLDDLYDIARAFVGGDPNGNDRNDEIGFLFSKNFFGGAGDPAKLFNAYGLYPRTWIEKDGKLVRGETMPEFKDVLNIMADLYKEGLIPKDFTIKDINKEGIEDVVSGKVGIYFGTAGSPATPELKGSNDSDGAQWEAYDMPTSTGEIIKAQYDSRVGNFYAVSAKNQHPEAAIKLLNLQLEIDAFNPDYATDNTFNISPNENMNFWCKPANINDPRNSVIKINAVLEAMNTGDVSKLNIEQKEEYGKATSDQWDFATMFKKGGSQEMRISDKYKDALWVSPAWGPETPTWVESGQDLHVKVQEYFIRAVTTGEVDKYFEEWLNYWETQGGGQVTVEINEWYSQNK